jgi:hypothetical protein
MKTQTLYTWYNYPGIQINAHRISSEMIFKQRNLGMTIDVHVISSEMISKHRDRGGRY